MAYSGVTEDVDVFKAAHHGGVTSNTELFLTMIRPEIVVISCGEDNDYGHPHRETLTALNRLHGLKKLLRTDYDKTVIFTADGKTENGISFTTQNPTVVE